MIGDLTERHMDVFKSNSYFKGVNIPVPETNVREQVCHISRPLLEVIS